MPGEVTIDPMNRSLSPMDRAPRCCAKTRSGGVCQSPAVKDRRRCRLHGGKSPGGPLGSANGRYKTGRFTKEMRALKAELRAWINEFAV